MKKSTLISSVILAVMGSGYAMVASSEVLTSDGADLNTVAATSKKITVDAIANRAGFVKNDFEITISATVLVQAADDAKAFGVSAGSEKGRAIFTGHSDGGSVTQCGDLVASNTDAAAVMETTRIDMAKKDGCTSNTSS